jgi:hypothetical protein
MAIGQEKGGDLVQLMSFTFTFTPLVTFYKDDLLLFLLKVAKFSFVQKYYLSTSPPGRG